MVAPAFGFSVGDFAQVIALIAKAAKALRETNGASSNFQQAAIELESLQSVLTKVQSLQPTVQNGDLIRNIHICGLACHIPLARFIEKIRKFEAHLGPDGCFAKPTKTSQHIKRNFRKIQWTIFFEKELAKLRTGIGLQLHVIEVLLQLESLERARQSNELTEKTKHQAQELLLAVDSLKNAFPTKPTSKDGIASLPSLFEEFSDRHDRHANEVLQITTSTETNMSDLQAQLVVQEKLLTWTLSQLEVPLLAEIALPRPFKDSNEPNNLDAIVPSTEHKVAQIMQLGPIEVQLFNVLLAVRKGVIELMLMLMCIFPAVQRVLRSLAVVARAPTLLLQNNIHLEDALGRVMSLPYEHFRYWPVMLARLQVAFVGVPGESKVKLNQFHIMNLRGKESLVLTRNNWARLVFPGSRLAMSMLVQDVYFKNRICPGCNVEHDAEGPSGSEWNTCKACGLTYRMLEVTRDRKSRNLTSALEVDTEDDIMDGVEFLPDSRSIESLRYPDDLQFFKRIHRVKHKPRRSDYGNNITAGESPSAFDIPTTGQGETKPTRPKGILKKPTEKFPEYPPDVREGVAPLRNAGVPGIPPDARWTKIDRLLVNPEALEEAKERFEEEPDHVIVLRVLTGQEIRTLADRTKAIRDKRTEEERASFSPGDPIE